MSNVITQILEMYLRVTISKLPADDTVIAKKFYELILRKDPTAIEFLQKHAKDPVLSPYAGNDELLEALRDEFGTEIETSEECIRALQYFRDESKNEALRKAMEKSISFLQLPEGTPIVMEDYPFSYLEGIVDDWVREFVNQRGFVTGTLSYLEVNVSVSEEPTLGDVVAVSSS